MDVRAVLLPPAGLLGACPECFQACRGLLVGFDGLDDAGELVGVQACGSSFDLRELALAERRAADTCLRLTEALQDARHKLTGHLRAKANPDPALSQLDWPARHVAH